VSGYAPRFSAESGLRLGELVALDWPNVYLTNGCVYVEWTWDAEAGPVKPKDGDARHAYLTKEARIVIEDWVKVDGARDAGPVFPNPLGGGRLIARQVQRRLGNAMEDAGVPKQHPGLHLPHAAPGLSPEAYRKQPGPQQP